MSNGTNIDPAALAAARERLREFETGARGPYSGINRDLRLVLDALRDARRQAFEEAADIANDKVISCCDDDYECGSNEAASTIEREIRALAAKEQA